MPSPPHCSSSVTSYKQGAKRWPLHKHRHLEPPSRYIYETTPWYCADHGIALIIFDTRHPSQKSHLFWLREVFSLNWKRPFFSQDSNHGQQINPTSSLSSTLLAPCRAWAELSLGTLSYTKEPTPQIQNRLELPGEIAVLVWIGTKIQPNLYYVH